MSDVTERIKQIIKSDGLIQYSVATRAGFSQNQFNALLNGRKTFDIKFLIPICKALNRSPNEVLGFASEPPPEAAGE
jgi:transcriptional regulator with XRE-family HTH domain